MSTTSYGPSVLQESLSGSSPACSSGMLRALLPWRDFRRGSWGGLDANPPAGTGDAGVVVGTTCLAAAGGTKGMAKLSARATPLTRLWEGSRAVYGRIDGLCPRQTPAAGEMAAHAAAGPAKALEAAVLGHSLRRKPGGYMMSSARPNEVGVQVNWQFCM